MDKIKSILASASGRKVGPPVPPRPSPSKVQEALEKTRHQSPVVQKISPPPIIHGRSVIFSSTTAINNNEHVDHQLTQPNIASREKNCFDTECDDDSSAGLASKAVQVGNIARVNVNKVNCVNEAQVIKVGNEPHQPIILHHKSPVARPRSRAPIFVNQSEDYHQICVNNRINAPLSTEVSFQPNGYANLLMRNQNSQQLGNLTAKVRENVKNRDDELKQKLMNEMLNRSNPVEAANKHVKYNGSNLKRASSFDALNESLGENSSDKKVIFHEMLISELSEMRRDLSPRLSAAKSSPDISRNGNMNIFEIDNKKSFNTFVSLEDSGVEDEGKMDDCSSSGVGDSWDSCKEMETR
jgi:hypothetical protein